jgi:biotin synthase
VCYAVLILETMKTIETILKQNSLGKSDIVQLLQAEGDDRKALFTAANTVKLKEIGNQVYYRGLLEFSNICAKNCFYCGIRRGNKQIERYFVSEQEVLDAVKFAHKENYGSIVIQAGERSDKYFVDLISDLLVKIGVLTNHELGITLSLGEQTKETYKRWKNLGAKRYLLRMEATSTSLYEKLHPNDSVHSYEKRLNSLKLLQSLNYQTGTGVMIGLPFQTLEDLADDLLFFKEFDIDMVGMGPYIEHHETPLFEHKDKLMSKEMRFDLTLKMIAVLRLMMPDINIAATTAMQSIDKLGREKALKVGANILMPNITPVKYREGYLLYENKPCLDEDAAECKTCLEARVHLAGDKVAYGEHGDSKHFARRIKTV